MEEKIKEILAKLDTFLLKNRTSLKWLGVAAAIMVVLNAFSGYLTYGAVKKLDGAKNALDQAKNELAISSEKIKTSQDSIAKVLKGISMEKEKLQYYQVKFDQLRKNIEINEAKTANEKAQLNAELNTLTKKAKDLEKTLGI